MNKIDNIISERASTHGDFYKISEMTQKIKYTLRRSVNYNDIPWYGLEVLDMIAHKLSRALCGQFEFYDHWDDIVGYAKLGVIEAEKDFKLYISSTYHSTGVKEDHSLFNDIMFFISNCPNKDSFLLYEKDIENLINSIFYGILYQNNGYRLGWAGVYEAAKKLNEKVTKNGAGK